MADGISVGRYKSIHFLYFISIPTLNLKRLFENVWSNKGVTKSEFTLVSFLPFIRIQNKGKYPYFDPLVILDRNTKLDSRMITNFKTSCIQISRTVLTEQAKRYELFPVFGGDFGRGKKKDGDPAWYFSKRPAINAIFLTWLWIRNTWSMSE